ncbi:MAG: GNAT family N-acetyltransferase [Rhodocyclaceae bacterium]|nr:GNAT family N-acetyltransferase [Rhodocyclaceae bacterium]
MNAVVDVIPLDFDDAAHTRALVELLDHYARDPMGGGSGLAEAVKAVLPERLREIPHFYSALAFVDGRPVGLINCFFGFSTFAAEPLLNIHDIVVHADLRGRGIGQALLAHAEALAREMGCCKLTLEVLSNNQAALAAYERSGFRPYVLDPAAGQALFLQKRFE